MDRSERTPIVEPILLILKQRTGIASVLSIVLAVSMLVYGFEINEVILVISPIFAFVAKQTFLDAGENSERVVKEVIEALEEAKDVIAIIGLVGEDEDESDVGEN